MYAETLVFSEVPTTLRVIAASVRLIKERFMWADVMPVYRMLGLSMAMMFTVVLCLLLLLVLAKTLSVVDAGQRLEQQLSNMAASGDVRGYGDPAPYIENLDVSSNGLNGSKLKQVSSPEQAWAIADEGLLMGAVDGQLGLTFCDAVKLRTPCDARVECFDRAGHLTD